MRYLFDTCVVSELTKRVPDPAVLRFVESCDESSVYLSVLTVGEIVKGITKLADAQRRTLLEDWLENRLKPRFHGRVLAITDRVAEVWGEVQGAAERDGCPIPTIDGLLGATAIVHDLVVVTRNESDIGRTGAKVLNPWTK